MVPVGNPRKPDRATSIRSLALFNARKLDLPDGFFDRKTQFVINGAPFETLLGAVADRSADPDARAWPRRFPVHGQGAATCVPGRAHRSRRDRHDEPDPLDPDPVVAVGQLRGSGERLNGDRRDAALAPVVVAEQRSMSSRSVAECHDASIAGIRQI